MKYIVRFLLLGILSTCVSYAQLADDTTSVSGNRVIFSNELGTNTSLIQYDGTNYPGTVVFTGDAVSKTETGFEFILTDISGKQDANTNLDAWASIGVDTKVSTNNVDYTNALALVLTSMSNYIHVASSTNWLAYDGATKTLSGCVTNNGVGIYQPASTNLDAWALIGEAAKQAASTNLDAWADIGVDTKVSTNNVDYTNALALVLTSMSNYTHVASPTNWLAYDGATKTLSGCVTNSGDLDDPFQEYTSTIAPDAGGTCTISYASGNLVKIAVDTNITIWFDNTDYPTNGVNRVAIDVWAPTNTVAFDNDNVTNAVSLVFTNKSPASLFFRKSLTNTLWWGRQ